MKDLLQKLSRHENLSATEMSRFGEALTAGQLPEASAAAFLMGLAMKGETVEEIVSLVELLRSKMIPVPGLTEALDTCGTGGDGMGTLNASTMAAFVCAAAGVPIAKHGNRAVSSHCGSFDLLEALGVKINLTAGQARACFESTGLTFLFAPNFHPAFKHIAPIRQALGIRTIFNFLGPLLNPGGVKRQVIGVSVPEIGEKLGAALIKLGSERVLIINSHDGLDEASPAAPTRVVEFTSGSEPKEFIIEPEKIYSLDLVRGGSPQANAARTLAILTGKGTPAENELIALNAGLGLYAANAVPVFLDGKKLALDILQAGQAARKLEELVAFTNKF